MSEKIDLSLDEIIKREGITGKTRKRGSVLQSRSRPTFRRSFGGRSSRGFGGRNRQSSRTRTQPYFRSPNKTNNKLNPIVSGRLLISNLAYSVSNEDLEELFASFGPLKKLCIHYDLFGYSLGTAEVVFEMISDAITARNKYNGVPLDGRYMRIQLLNAPPTKPQNERQFEPSRGRSAGTRGRKNVTAEDLDKELDNWKMEVE